MIQSASTPPPSPPMARMAMVMGRMRAAPRVSTSGVFIFPPFVPAKAGTQSHRKKELDSRLRGNERRIWRPMSNEASCRHRLPIQPPLQEADHGVAHTLLEAIPSGRVVDDRGLIEGWAKHRSVRDLAAIAAADAGID